VTNVRCWNCGMDFEILSSAENSNKPSLPVTIYIPGMSDTDNEDE
jgi:hypothetical protein